MDTRFHEIIPCLVLRQLPDLKKLFRSQDHTEHMLMQDAVRPDAVYHDSIAQHAETHFAHSYKQKQDSNGNIHWDKGDCIERVKAVAIDAVNCYRSGDLDLACRFLGEWSHYRIDAMTYPHIGTYGAPWSVHHMPWEVEMAHWIVKNEDRIGKLAFEPQKDLYKSAVADARAMFAPSMALAAALEKGKPGLDDTAKLKLCRRIAKAVGDGWLTISAQLRCKG